MSSDPMADLLANSQPQITPLHEIPEDLRFLPDSIREHPKYKFIRQLGKGGMGQVYLAHRRDFERRFVAVKLMLDEALRNETARKRFEQEVAVLFTLQHTNIGLAIDFEATMPAPILIMEYIDGGSLQDQLDQAKKTEDLLSISTVCNWIYQAAQGFHYAHENKVIHRDVKPHNLMLNKRGEIKIVDFGLVRWLEQVSDLTQSNQPMGSILYMSPEQCKNPKKVTLTSDVYSLGCTFYELLTNRLPYEAEGTGGWLIAHMNDEPFKIGELRSDIPGNLASLVHDMLQKDATRRPSMMEVAQRLRPFLYASNDQLLINHTDQPSQQVAKVETIEPTKLQVVPQTRPKPDLLDCTAKNGANADTVQAIQRAWAKYLDVPVETAIDLGGGIKLEIVLIPPGTYWMGATKEEQEIYVRQGGQRDEWLDWELPQHVMTITKPFYLGKYQVTQEEYKALMHAEPSKFKKDKRNPVERVSWEDAQEFCQRLAQRSLLKGFRKVRLPSEAEWEYACRGGTRTVFHFGNSLNGQEANCDGTVPFGTTTKGPSLGATCRVGSYKANGFGLYDMHGNVSEWCEDNWYGKAYASGVKEDRIIKQSNDNPRVLRGGSWHRNSRYCRSALRNWGNAGNRFNNIGFRICFPLD